MNKQKISNLLGLAQRAGKLISGEAKLVFLANDAASNLTKKVTDKGRYYEVQVSTVFSTLELSTAIGRARKVVAVVDAGFSKKMRSLME